MKHVKLITALLLFSLMFGFEAKIEHKNTSNFINHCLSDNEYELFDRINAHREWVGMEHIELSKALSFVARQHAKDFVENVQKVGKCNLHSWSDKGAWSPVCYTSNYEDARSMWAKPKELTNYLANGYEISAMTSEERISPTLALELWKGSKGHEDIILNRKEWKTIDWKAVGVGIYKGYACVWFGELNEEEGNSFACGR